MIFLVILFNLVDNVKKICNFYAVVPLMWIDRSLFNTENLSSFENLNISAFLGWKNDCVDHIL